MIDNALHRIALAVFAREYIEVSVFVLVGIIGSRIEPFRSFGGDKHGGHDASCWGDFQIARAVVGVVVRHIIAASCSRYPVDNAVVGVGLGDTDKAVVLSVFKGVGYGILGIAHMTGLANPIIGNTESIVDFL